MSSGPLVSQFIIAFVVVLRLTFVVTGLLLCLLGLRLLLGRNNFLLDGFDYLLAEFLVDALGRSLARVFGSCASYTASSTSRAIPSTATTSASSSSGHACQKIRLKVIVG